MIAFIHSIDMAVLKQLYALRSYPVSLVLIYVSELGQWYVVCGLSLIYALIMGVRKNSKNATILFFSVIATALTVLALKALFQISRPESMFQAYPEMWYSFPSAHAALSAVFYGSIWLFLDRHVHSQSPFRLFALIVLPIVIVAVCFSRLYLGVHYLSDVVVGLIIGIAYIVLSERIHVIKLPFYRTKSHIAPATTIR